MKLNQKYIILLIVCIALILAVQSIPGQNSLTKKQISMIEIFNNKLDALKKDKSNQKTIKFKNGKIVKYNSLYYGYMQDGKWCVSINHNQNKPILSKNKCKDVEFPTTIVDAIKNDKNVKDDDELTGLDSDYPFSSKRYFVGDKPNNYIVYSNYCWRIVNTTQNDNTKIIYEGPVNKLTNNCEEITKSNSGSIGLYRLDNYKDNLTYWNNTYLKDLMEDWIKFAEIDNKQVKINLDINQLSDADWYMGSISLNNNSLLEDIKEERKDIYKRGLKLGLLNNSDYLKVSCKTSSANSLQKCSTNNYLYKSNYNWWTINSTNVSEQQEWLIMNDGKVDHKKIILSNEYFFSGVRLAAYLKNNLKVLGYGTETDPYRILNK